MAYLDVPDACSNLIQSLVGAVVDYDALPYQMGDPQYKRLEIAHVTINDEIHLGYVLDLQAAADFVMQSVPNGRIKYSKITGDSK